MIKASRGAARGRRGRRGRRATGSSPEITHLAVGSHQLLSRKAVRRDSAEVKIRPPDRRDTSSPVPEQDPRPSVSRRGRGERQSGEYSHVNQSGLSGSPEAPARGGALDGAHLVSPRRETSEHEDAGEGATVAGNRQIDASIARYNRLERWRRRGPAFLDRNVGR